MIENPVLRGFHPDPSILRVGNDYYIAVSTFEWFPGIGIYHSRDLKNWRLFSHVLTRPSQLDLRGIAPSKGVWAPCLSHAPREARFYLCYSFVKGIVNNYFDLDNFLVTAPDIRGPWSDPVYLNSSGFDPSLFHDEDGRKWLLNLEWDFRKGYEHPGAIVIQEYSPDEKKLCGEPRRIYRGGTDMGCQEGAHLYRRHGDYYLTTAEGGTGYGHGVVIARSGNLFGPFEPDPQNPIVTSTAARFNRRGNPDPWHHDLYNPEAYLQKSGHGSLVETQSGEFYLAHLCGRPVLPEKRCMLGRETALQKVVWSDDGWLRLAAGGNLAQRFTPQPDLPEIPFTAESVRDDFESPVLNPHFITPRVPVTPSWASLTERNGFLRLRGRDSLFSLFDQSLIARRIQAVAFQAETFLEFEPDCFQQMAGLVCLYDNLNFYYLRVYYSESLQSKCLGLMLADRGNRDELLEHRAPLRAGTPIWLRVTVRIHALQFAYATDGDNWADIGPVFDATKLSDEYCDGFTGAMVGICAQDLSKREKCADFDYFAYREIEAVE